MRLSEHHGLPYHWTCNEQMNQFPPFINLFNSRPRHEIEIVMARSKPETFDTGDFFLSAGQTSHRAGYIEEGVIRMYHLNEKGEERTLGFAAEGEFVIDMEGYRQRKPSLRNWRALTPVKMIVWEREDMKWIGEQLPGWNLLMNDLVQKVLYNRTIELFEMLEDDATTRYQKFTQRYPHILSRVPLRHVANYLGIAPQSLSRIRQQLTNVDRKINK